MWFFDKKKIKVVHDKNLQKFLSEVGIYDDIISNKIKCKFTKEDITLDNFYSIFKLWWDIKVVSDSPEAIKLFSIFLNNKKWI